MMHYVQVGVPAFHDIEGPAFPQTRGAGRGNARWDAQARTDRSASLGPILEPFHRETRERCSHCQLAARNATSKLRYAAANSQSGIAHGSLAACVCVCACLLPAHTDPYRRTEYCTKPSRLSCLVERNTRSPASGLSGEIATRYRHLRPAGTSQSSRTQTQQRRGGGNPKRGLRSSRARPIDRARRVPT